MRFLALFLFLPALVQAQRDSSIAVLDSVIISTGYQQLRANEVNGSFTTIDNKTLNQQSGTAILQRLNNVASGVQFTVGKSNSNGQNNTNITIRGLSTINGPLDPLIVLDNFIYEGNINNINPNDVERMTILKDAAATSIYGARGGNGVIVITTKKGRRNQRLQIEANANVIVGEQPDLLAVASISSADYLLVEQRLFNAGFFNTVINRQFLALTPGVEILLARRNGLISAADSAAQMQALAAIDGRKAFTDQFYRSSVTQQYALNLRGGGAKSSWLVSGAFDKGITELSAEHHKANIRLHYDYYPIKKLQLHTGLLFTSATTMSGKPSYNIAQISGRQVPYLNFTDPLAPVYRPAFTDTFYSGKLLDWHFYPTEDWKHNRFTDIREEMVANLGAEYQLLPYLTLQLQYQYQRQLSNGAFNAGLESYSTRSLINQFTQFDEEGKLSYNVPMGAIVRYSNGKQYSHQGRAQLNFRQQWVQHELSAFAGAEIRDAAANSRSYTVYGVQEDPLTVAAIDNVNAYPNLVSGIPQRIGSTPTLTGTANRFVSVYANAAYTFRNRYSISGSVRRDGSNILGVKTNDRWKPLWSAGLGWEISRESFYQSTVIPYLKLRTSYGYSGNVDLALSALPTAQFVVDETTNLPAAMIRVINNPLLRWEQSGQWNIGVDFATKGRRISGTMEYYTKRGTDLYGDAPYDYTGWGGQPTITRNVASMKGEGVDVTLHAQVLRGAFQWNLQLLYSYNQSTTTDYYRDPSTNTLYNLIGAGSKINPVPGKPLYAIAGYKWGGLDASGNPQGYLNGDLSTNWLAISQGVMKTGMASGSVEYIGSAVPTSYGALINQFAFKGWALSFNISYRFGYYFRKPSLSYSSLVSTGNGHAEFAQRWQQPGDELRTNVPAFIYPANNSRDAFYSNAVINILKADNIRLAYVNLSRSFKWFTLYANAANLAILWKANNAGLDPDYPGIVAPVRQYTIGIRTSFQP